MGRNYYYGNTYTPHFYLDGNIDGGSSSGNWNNMITNRAGMTPLLDVEIYGERNETTRFTEIEIHIAAPYPITQTNLKLRIAIVESELYYPGPNGVTMHHQIFRDMIPNTSGRYFTISQGENLIINESFTYDYELLPENCDIIAFIQSDTNKGILQGAKEGLTTLMSEPYRLDRFGLVSPGIEDTINVCYPEFVWHASDDPDSGFTISYEVEIDTDSFFVDPILSGPLSDTTWDTQVCLYDNHYYWRVRATNNSAPDVYSTAIHSFDIMQYGRIRGTVTDEDLNPVPNVFVELIGSQKYDSTDVDGSYIIDSVFAGTYNIFYYCPGYEDTLVTDVVLIPADTAIVNVVLIEGPGCYYIPGDANGTGATNGLDVTYLVTYFKGGPHPPFICDCGTYGAIYSAADANGSCAVNGLDVTYLVNYFKGLGEILYCVQCPPTP